MCSRYFLYQTIDMLIVRFPYYSENLTFTRHFLINDTWHTVTFLYMLFRNLSFTWDFLDQWHMACCYIHFLYYSEIWHLLGQQHMACRYISYSYYSKIWHLHDVTLVNDMWHTVKFLYYSKIWHLHEISFVNDTWHAVTFPMLFRSLTFTWRFLAQWCMVCCILFRNLTFTWDFLGQRHMACCYISYAIQKFDIYLRFLWSMIHGMLLHFLYYSEICLSVTHGMPLHFLCYLEIWHLHEIPWIMMYGMPLHFLYCS